jgi:lysophospholipase L1-like esterase
MAAIAEKLAEKHGHKFMDLQKTFDEAVKTIPAKELSADGVHPTDKGHEIITKEWIKLFNELNA